VNISYHDRMLELMGKMLPILPGASAGKASPLDSFFFWNSGAEAVEVRV
jgi:acetylornithine/succinyldiaminopimelate/putrescine aminotransferase